MSYEAVIFDHDGVLLSIKRDPSVFERMIEETFREFGVTDPSVEEVRAFMGSLDLDEMWSICNDYGVDLEEFWRAREMRSSEIQKGMVMEGERSLYSDVRVLDRLNGLPLGIVSNNQDRTVNFVVDHYGLEQFDSVYGREPSLDGIRRMKPSPYYLDRTLDDLGTNDAVYVGDSKSDVLAAESAGIDSIYVQRPHTVDLDVEATHITDDLRGVVELLQE